MNLATINKELIAAKPYAKSISPGLGKLFVGPAATAWKIFSRVKLGGGFVAKKSRGTAVPVILGEYASGKWTDRFITRTRIQPAVLAGHFKAANSSSKDSNRKNGMGGRSWIDKPGRYTMVIVFHDANKAGPHIDVHIDRLSVIYRVKPDLYAQLRYNTDGYLTQDSQKLLIDHVKSEIAGGSRVPQNLDHSLSNARMGWVKGGTDGTDYGAGPTRQVISETEVDVYKTGEGHPIEFYAPLLNPHRPLYLYQLYPGEDNRAPILIWGAKKSGPPHLEDRLHLKMIHPEEMEKLDVKADLSTSTAKYDGASAYIVITNKGTTAWSPRESAVTGEQIEYTMKLNGIASVSSDETIVAMGEVLFKDRKGNYLPCAQGSGILNSNIVLPEDVTPEIRLYRVDRIGRERTKDLPFWDNRKLQEKVAGLDRDHFKVVELMSPEKAQKKGFEGVVVAPQTVVETIFYPDWSQVDLDALSAAGEEYVFLDDIPVGNGYDVMGAGSINDGYKVKWWTDPHDWRIDQVAFEPGPNGGLAGVLHCTSLESGKPFRLGPGQVGNRELTEDMMAFPERYVGNVLKVNSRHGHEGRAAKVIGFHDDKGLSAT